MYQCIQAKIFMENFKMWILQSLMAYIILQPEMPKSPDACLSQAFVVRGLLV